MRPDADPSPGREAIDLTAADWLTRRDAGLSPVETAELARWRAADPRHDAALRRAEAAQHLLARLPEVPGAAALHAELDALERERHRPAPLARFRPWQVAVALAAAACLALAVWLPWRAADRSHATYTTAAGHHQSIDLPDGSTLVLNADSTVDVAFVPQERRVNLQRGEAHFYVAKDADRPFLVSAGLVTVRAVGTAFNVRRHDAAVEVLVTEGKVRVSRNGSPNEGSAAAQPLFLTAGQRAVIEATSTAHFVRAPGDALDADDPHAWRAPRLLFSDTPLADVVDRFNRYSRVQMEIADPELGRRAVGGAFDADNAEAFLNLLIAGGDVRVERVSATHVVLHKAP